MRISGGERALAALGYLPFPFWLVPLKFKRDSMFVQFHARQGMVLFLLWFAAALVMLILVAIFDTGFLNTLFFGLLFLATLVYVAAALLTILFKVFTGERYRMPLVADVALMLRL